MFLLQHQTYEIVQESRGVDAHRGRKKCIHIDRLIIFVHIICFCPWSFECLIFPLAQLSQSKKETDHIFLVGKFMKELSDLLQQTEFKGLLWEDDTFMLRVPTPPFMPSLIIALILEVNWSIPNWPSCL